MAYSRLQKIEQRKHRSRAFLLVFFTVVIVVLAIRYSFSVLPKISLFIDDFSGRRAGSSSTDNIPPAPPSIKSLPLQTNKLKITIQGMSEPGSKVTLNFNGATKDLIANSSGEFSSKVTLVVGENIIFANATDQSGNKSAQGQRVSVFFDTEPPSLEIIQPLDGQQFYGTQGRSVSVEGTTEKNVSVTINDRVVVLGRDGKFKKSLTLVIGENKIKVVVIDAAGNETVQEFIIYYSE